MVHYSLASRRGGLATGRGGLLALVWPVALVVLAIASMQGTSEALATETLVDPAAPVVAGLLFLVAIPTTWVFSLIGLTPTVSVGLGVVTSLPMWFVLGSRLADTSWDWTQWLRRYLAYAVIWVVVALFLLLSIASIVD